KGYNFVATSPQAAGPHRSVLVEWPRPATARTRPLGPCPVPWEGLQVRRDRSTGCGGRTAASRRAGGALHPPRVMRPPCDLDSVGSMSPGVGERQGGRLRVLLFGGCLAEFAHVRPVRIGVKTELERSTV